MHAHSRQRSCVRRRSTRAQSNGWYTHTCAALGTCMSRQRGCICRRNTRAIASVWHAHMCAALSMCTSGTHAHASVARARTSVARSVCHMCSVLARYAHARLQGMHICTYDARTRTPAMHAHARQWHERLATCALRLRRGLHKYVCSTCACATAMHARARQRCTRTSAARAPYHMCSMRASWHAHSVCLHVCSTCTCAPAMHARARTSAARAPYHMRSTCVSWHAHGVCLHAHVQLRSTHARAH